jgi:hypothetical protein
MDEPKSATWKNTVILGAMTLVTSTAGYVSSHWGGVSSDQLKDTEARIATKVDNVKWDVAKGADEMKRYVDEKVTASEARILAAQPKKRKAGREQP